VFIGAVLKHLTFEVSVRIPLTWSIVKFNGTNVLNQIITIAGINTNAYSGDNGSATNAALNGPSGVGVDSAGNIYIADTQNQRIRKVATNGIITTIAGTGVANFYGQNVPATSAYLNTQIGLAVDSNGQIYIGDAGNFRVRRIDTNGIISTYAGNGTAGDTGDNGAATSDTFQYHIPVLIPGLNGKRKPEQCDTNARRRKNRSENGPARPHVSKATLNASVISLRFCRILSYA
jgi:hypothetical protein